MSCKPQWADSSRPVCTQRNISKNKSKKLKRILDDLRYNPAKLTVDEAYGDILLLLDYFDVEVH